MKKKLLLYAALPVLGLGFLGLNMSSAHGLFSGFGLNLTPDQIATRQQDMFQKEADLLGISVDDVKNGWADGKTLLQIAQDHGITKEQLQQKMKDAQLQQMETQLQTLVDKGVITQAQADKRMQVIEQQFATGNYGKGFFGGMRHHHGMMGGGIGGGTMEGGMMGEGMSGMMSNHHQ